MARARVAAVGRPERRELRLRAYVGRRMGGGGAGGGTHPEWPLR